MTYAHKLSSTLALYKKVINYGYLNYIIANKTKTKDFLLITLFMQRMATRGSKLPLENYVPVYVMLQVTQFKLLILPRVDIASLALKT